MAEFLLLGFPGNDGEICLIAVDPAVPMGRKCFKEKIPTQHKPHYIARKPEDILTLFK